MDHSRWTSEEFTSGTHIVPFDRNCDFVDTKETRSSYTYENVVSGALISNRDVSRSRHERLHAEANSQRVTRRDDRVVGPLNLADPGEEGEMIDDKHGRNTSHFIVQRRRLSSRSVRRPRAARNRHLWPGGMSRFMFYFTAVLICGLHANKHLNDLHRPIGNLKKSGR